MSALYYVKSRCIMLLLFLIGFLSDAIAQGPCSPVSTLPCSSVTVALPFALNFNNAAPATITDKNGVGTGFTTVNTYSGTRVAVDGNPSNAAVTGYEAGNITLTGGRLQLLTSKGIDYQTNNNLLNGLGVKINTSRKVQIEVKVINPFNGTQSQQAGLWYGINDKTFIKLTISANKVELRKEVNDVSNTQTGTGNPDQRTTSAISGLNNQTVTLRMVIDSAAATVEGFYSTDGVNFMSTGAAYPVKTLSIANMAITDSVAYTSIYATHRNATSAVTYNFDDFAVSRIIDNVPQPGADCSPISTLPCDSIKVKFPFAINFDAPVPNTIADKNGSGTGFRTINVYSGSRTAEDGTPSNPDVPGYEPTKITLTGGRLQLVTNKGIDYLTNNNLLNVLGVKVNTIGRLQMEVKLVNPFNGTQAQQAGLWYGLNDKTFVKLDITGNKVELRKEENDVASTTSGTSNPDQRITAAITGLNNQTVTLRLVIDSLLNTAEGFYSTDGVTYYSTGAAYSSPAINIAGMGITDSAAFAGIYATHRNSASPVTYSFDDFTISGSHASGPNPQPSGAYMVLRNMDTFPADDQLVFSLIQTPWRRTNPDTTPYNANHDKVRLRISNKGTARLTLNSLTLSNATSWKIAAIGTDTTATFPVNVNQGTYVDVTVQFRAQNAATRVKVFHDTLSIASNDATLPLKKVLLHGIWQKAGESTNEPYAQQIINGFGFTTNTGYGHDDGNINGTARIPNSNEVNADYFVRADTTKPVKVFQLAAYHGCCASVESFRYFEKGSASNRTVLTHHPLDGQSVVPRLINTANSPAQATFTPVGSFGIRVGSSSTDRTQNAEGLIGIRVLKVYDSNGNLVPNAYFLNGDYLGTSFTNYDYQDNIYYVENIKPETGSPNYSELALLPVTAVNFSATLTGETANVNLTLKNMGVSHANGSNDPAIKIKSRVITGPDAAEFALGSLTSTTIPIQSTASLGVTFKPVTTGIKNSVLLITYDNSPVPLRVPLYGIGNNATTTTNVVKRIKGASDSNVTIGNVMYEMDKNYRKGSIKLDKQIKPAPIYGTDTDSLYQTYLSAAADLVETRYEIPVANGDYQLRLHFAEAYWTTPGSRVFGINIENVPVLQNFDIFKEVGYNAAVVKDFNVTVNDGVLNIKFNPAANRVAIAAVELFNTTNNPSLLMASMSSKHAPATRSIMLYPNPNPGSSFNISAQNFGKNEKVLINVTNLAGRLIKTHSFTTNELGRADIFLLLDSVLNEGIYIVNATTATGVAYAKLLVK